jgi:hypothetical protein
MDIHGGGESKYRLAGWPSLSNVGGDSFGKFFIPGGYNLPAPVASENKQTIMDICQLPDMTQPIADLLLDHLIASPRSV